MTIGLSAFNWGLPILHVSLVPFKLNLQNLDVNAFIHQKRANSPYGQLLEHFPIFSWSFVRHHSPPCVLIESKVFRANLFDRDLIQEREELLLIVILQCFALSFLVDRHQPIHVDASPALHISILCVAFYSGWLLTAEQKLGSSPLRMKLEDPCQSWGRPRGPSRGGWLWSSPPPGLSSTQCRSAEAPKQLVLAGDIFPGKEQPFSHKTI